MRQPKIFTRRDTKVPTYYTRMMVNGVRKYFDLGTDKERAATEYAQIMARYRGGVSVTHGYRPGNISCLSELRDSYLVARERDISPEQWATVKRYYDLLCEFNHPEGVLGGIVLDYFRPDHLTAWLDTMKLLRDWGPASVRAATIYAKALMRWAVAFGVIEKNPWQSVKAVTVPMERKVILSQADIDTLIAAGKTEATRAMFTLLYETLARPGELCAATWADVSLSSQRIVLTEHKTAHTTGNPRIIYLSDRAIEVLREMESREKGRLLFPGRSGKPKAAASVRLAMNRAIAGMPAKTRKRFENVTPYTLRRSHATHMMNAGVPLRVIAEIMGNSTPIAWTHYTLPAPHDVLAALDSA